jgi:PERQ amino acid-rich with GYF domain-containing protein
MSDLRIQAFVGARRQRTIALLRVQLETDTTSRPRRTNGATQTFRRPSLATSISTSQPRESNTAQNRNSGEAVGVYIPPHLSASRNGASSENRYTRDQMLSLFRNQRESGDLNNGLSSLYVSGWEPNVSNGTSGSSWSRRDEQKDSQVTADVCWDRDGSVQPLALSEMTVEEREVRVG